LRAGAFFTLPEIQGIAAKLATGFERYIMFQRKTLRQIS
jgi:hypothetical protein